MHDIWLRDVSGNSSYFALMDVFKFITVCFIKIRVHLCSVLNTTFIHEVFL